LICVRLNWGFWMIDFFELEKKCKKIKNKKFVKIIVVLTFLSLLIGAFFVLNTTSKQKNTKTTSTTTQNKTQIKSQIKSQIKKQAKTSKKLTKAPTKNQTKTKPLTPTIGVNIDFSSIPTKIETKKQKTSQTNQNSKTTKNIPNQPKLIISNSTSFEYAFNLAQNYYKQKNYKQSILWCKRASAIDNTNEKLWKLYALNLLAVGQKQKAIKVLKTYLKYKNSIDIQYLLQRIE